MATIKGLGGGGEIISQLFPVKTWKSSGKAQCWWCTTLWIHSVPLNWTPKIYWNGKLYVMYNSPQLKQQMHGVWENAGVKFRSLFFLNFPWVDVMSPWWHPNTKELYFCPSQGWLYHTLGGIRSFFCCGDGTALGVTGCWAASWTFIH